MSANLMKRALSLLLTLALLMGNFPAVAFATEEAPTEMEVEETVVPTEVVTDETTAATEEPAVEETVAPTEAATEPVEETIHTEDMAIDASAGVFASGTCGENLIWELDVEGTLTISGTGKMYDYSWNSNYTPWYDYRNQITNVVLESGVTNISQYAFYNCNNLKHISIPETVTSIGVSAFEKCYPLAEVVLPKSLKRIERNAFWDNAITEITIPENVTFIAGDAFDELYNLTKITFLGNAPEVDGRICNTGVLLAYPANNPTWTIEVLTQIGLLWIDPETGKATAAGHCGENAYWKLMDGVLTVSGTGDTSGCYTWDPYKGYITKVVVEEGITRIGYCAFCDCDNLESVSIPGSVTEIDSGAFQNCMKLRTLTIPAGVRYINGWAFAGWGSQQRIVFQGDAPEIDHYAFAYSDLTISYPGNNPTWADIVTTGFYACTLNWEERFEPVALEINTLPVKTMYQVGDTEIDLAGLTLRAMDVYCSSWIVYPEDGVAVKEVNTAKAGLSRVTVEWSGLTANYEIGVHGSGGEERQPASGYPSADYYLDDSPPIEESWNYSVPGADRLKLTFTGNTHMEEFFDCLYLYNGHSGDLLGKYTGNELSGKTVVVDGDAVKIRLSSDGSWTDCEFGFSSIYAEFYGHEAKNKGVYTAPTCISDGYTTHTCKICSQSYVVWSAGTAAHVYEDGFCIVCGMVEDAIDSGNVTDDIIWSISKDCCLALSGKGEVPDYAAESWSKYNDLITEVRIGNGITGLGSGLFAYRMNLTSVTMADSVRWMGNSVFYSCPNLKTVKLSENLEEIAFDTFSECMNLSQVNIPGKITAIRGFAFNNCALTEVVIPATVTRIEGSAFSGNYKLTQITFTGNAPNMDGDVFSGVQALVVYPGSNSTWTEEVRHGYGGNLLWVDAETGIIAQGRCGRNAYWSLNADCVLTISGSGTIEFYDEISGQVYDRFTDYLPHVKSLVIEEGITAITSNEGIFAGAYKMKSVELPDSLLIIGQNAFSYTGLTDVTIPKAVEFIGSCAFAYNYDLQHITFVGNAPNMDGDVFCNVQAFVVYPGSNPTWTEEVRHGYGGYLLWADAETGIIAQGRCGRNAYWSLDVDGVVTVSGSGEVEEYYYDEISGAYGSFADYKQLIRHVVIEEGITAIGYSAFAYTPVLQSVELPDSLEAIGEFAFFDSGLVSIMGGAGVTRIDDDAFNTCRELKYFELPNGLREIGYMAFNSSGLTKVVLPETLEFLGYESFGYCEQLEEIMFRGDVPQIEGEPFTGVKAVAYYPANNPTWTAEARQSCGGDLRWEPMYLTLGSADDVTYILSGKSLKVTAYGQNNTQLSADWAITKGAEYATVDDEGVVTAKQVEQVQIITVTAHEKQNGTQGSITLKILPRTAKLQLSTNVQDPENVDMKHSPTMKLEATADSENANVIWTTSAKTVATVDAEGEVTFMRPGTVTITAVDTYGIKGSVKINVYYLDTAEKITVTSDAPSFGLQPGEEAQLVVKGTDVLDALDLVFTSSNEAVATVDDNGRIIGGDQTGTVKITVAVKDDPLNRKAELSINVIAPQIAYLNLYTDEGYGELFYNKAQFEGRDYTFYISPEAMDGWYNSVELSKNSLKWTSSNTKLATIKIDKHGGAEVTIKKNADGIAVITAQTTDLAKITASLKLNVQDMSPRLTGDKMVMNPMKDERAETMLITSYGNGIQYIEDDNDALSTYYDSGTGVLGFFSETGERLKDGTYQVNLKAFCDDGYEYSYKLKITVKSSAPSITVKQTTKYNLFYTDSMAMLNITAKDAVIYNVEMSAEEGKDCDFNLFYDYESGSYYVYYCGEKDYADKKSDFKGTLRIWLEGYSYPVEKAITIATSNVKPKLALSAASSVVNTAMSEPMTGVAIYNQQTGELLVNYVYDVTMTKNKDKEDFASWYSGSEQIILSLNGTVNNNQEIVYSGGTATLYVRAYNWTESVKLTHKVTVQTKLPTVKAINLEVNNVFHWMESCGNITLDQNNVSAYLDEFTTKSDEAKEKLEVVYDWTRGCVCARILDPTINTGIYSYTAVPYTYEGVALKSVTIKVKVTATVPTVKLDASKVKLNSDLAGYECGYVKATVTKDNGFMLADFAGRDKWDEKGVHLFFEEGALVATLDPWARTGKYEYTLYPQFQEYYNGDYIATLPKPIKLTVEVYDGGSIAVTQTGKGKLDAVNPDSEIVYTISKLTNTLGKVDWVELMAGELDNDLFSLAVNENGSLLSVDTKGKQTFSLKLREDVVYSTKKTYQIKFTYGICGETVTMKTALNIKVSQSALKVSAPALNYYLSQSMPLRVNVNLMTPVNAQMAQITLNRDKTAKEMVAALGMEDDWVFEMGGTRSGVLELYVMDSVELTAGKTYKLVLDVIPTGNTEGTKPTQVTVNVKVMK